MPYVAVTLKKNLLATVSNESGSFEFKIPADIYDDTLAVSSIGYVPFSIALNQVSGTVGVRLKPSSTELKEVEILPMPPTHYIKIAVNKFSANYPQQPFQTQSYYREKLSENGNPLKLTEAVFKSYYPDYQDTSKVNQHQLLLFKEAESRDPEFMQSKRANKDEEGSISLGEIMGGPDEILKLDLVRSGEPFLDSNSFRYFDYTFGNSTTYNGRDLMVIEFKSRRAIEKAKSDGRIYIDNATDAIVSVHYTGVLRLPMLVRPAMFVLGLGITRPEYEKKLDYELIGDRWYPKNIQASLQATLTKKNLFSRNEHALFKIEAIFAVNKYITTEASPISPLKVFTTEKPMKDQVFNESGLTWLEINTLN